MEIGLFQVEGDRTWNGEDPLISTPSYLESSSPTYGDIIAHDPLPHLVAELEQSLDLGLLGVVAEQGEAGEDVDSLVWGTTRSRRKPGGSEE